MTPEDKLAIERLLHMAEVVASEPYPNPQAAMIHLVKAVRLMWAAMKDASDE